VKSPIAALQQLLSNPSVSPGFNHLLSLIIGAIHITKIPNLKILANGEMENDAR
jgi:hypothetical protein